MGVVVLLFMYLNKPSEEEIKAEKQRQEQLKKAEQAKSQNPDVVRFDSINPAETANIIATVRDLGVTDSAGTSVLKNGNLDLTVSSQDQLAGYVKAGTSKVAVDSMVQNHWSSLPPSIAKLAVKNLREGLANAAKYKGFAQCLVGDSTTVKLKNELLTLEISNKGGFITRATLNEYQAYDSTKVEVISPETGSYGFTFTTATQRFDTRNFFFKPINQSDTSVTMELDFGDNAKWAIKYTLQKHSYVVGIELLQQGMKAIIPSSVATLDFTWNHKMTQQEAGRVFEQSHSALYWMMPDGEVDNLSEGSDDNEEFNQQVKWIGCKNQFFSAILMARTSFASANLTSKVLENNPHFIKQMNIATTIDYNTQAKSPAAFKMFIGPNSYPLLGSLEKEVYPEENMHLTKVIPLGWAAFRWINTLIVIPVFTFLGSFISNYGIIILILTIFIKLILFPFTYKSYLSQARMKLLAPEIKEINEKYPGKENAMKRQQETMALYSRAGANPMSGCLPMLLQMPILIAMFNFFPSAIELRGESFLWAKDLSAPDAIISWTTNIPFISSTFGNHISLFCLLMTVTNIVYMRIMMRSQPSTMGGMKWMNYLMPVMFLFIFNNYASGLSYYYFLSLLITIIQTWVCSKFVSEEKMRAKMAENARKPKKKSGFMARLEEAQRKQQAMLREQQKRKGGR